MKDKVSISKGIKSLVSGNFISKILGLLREVLFSFWFGTGETAAAFRIAQTAYLLPVQALVGDSLSAGLLPLYKKLKLNGENQHQVLILCATLYATLLSLLITILLFLFANSIVAFIAPNSSSNLLNLASTFIKILALSIPFYIIASTLSFIETAYGYFTGLSYRPALLNILSIIGACLAVYFNCDYYLVILILISHILFFILTIIKIKSLEGIFPKEFPRFFILKETFSSFFKNTFPLLGLPLIAQINVLCERVISSKIGSNVIPAVDYARFLCDTTVQLIAVPLGIVTMAKYGGTKSESFDNYIKNVFLILIIVSFSIGLFCYQNANDIIKIVFERGEFNGESVTLTVSSFQWMGLALSFTITSYFLIKALNSNLKNNAAFIFTLIAVTVNMCINIFLWKELGPQTAGVGVLGYSLTLMILSIFYLNLMNEFLSIGIFLIVFLVGQFLINNFLKLYLDYNYIINFFTIGIVIFIYWVGFVLVYKRTRLIFYPIILKILK